MVSTRGVRYKFTEGERVLCYEPDPTKAKVLYDSKVLEVIESKDKRGRRSVEYLIHFQGWNSSWDRCVSEDFVLKDTEENRQLQRDLAEKSQLQLGAYLYRRERKKGSGAGPAKRARHGFSDDGSSSSTQPDDGSTGDTDSSTGSGCSSPHSPPPHQGRAHITLPSALRDRLTFDYHLVVKRGRLSRLPAAPSAAQVLESFVKWFARAGAWHPQRPRHDPPMKPDLRDVSCRLNLVREVADGLRVYFDFVLRAQLLYKQERQQYHELCGQFLQEDSAEEEEMKSEVEEEEGAAEAAAAEEAEDIKSPKIPEYSHLPPDPTEPDPPAATEEQSNNHEEPAPAATAAAGSEEAAANDASNSKEPAKSEPSADEADGKRPATRGNLNRRLRSHKSAVSQSENDEPAPCTSTGEQRAFETLSSSVGSSGSSLSECWARPAQAEPAAPPTRTPLSLLLEKVAKWQIIPREGTEHLPCRVYGAIHLARLFVKLPDFLNATQMPDFKLKLILKHIDMFVQYLDEHSEWFGEMYYIADNVSRSH
ncbi:protein male-specific lethal-3 isoform X2 [Leguminivora glycinivorella]|uniref:protein male-specific lethal-3 isoform X2 n=1 Tax=Leguminivora glycinivorella TaxID=1035111 RepID=UPI00200E781B|nr:protein male-specific lethal-3 isoform X2 [Leguminivora glycinivorella]